MSARRIKRKRAKSSSFAELRAVEEMLRPAYRELINQQEPFMDLLPGSFKQTTSTIRLNDELPSEKRLLVLSHEIGHAWLGRKHWGEAIKRLEGLQLLLFPWLNLVRYRIIQETGREKYGSDIGLTEINAADFADFTKTDTSAKEGEPCFHLVNQNGDRTWQETRSIRRHAERAKFLEDMQELSDKKDVFLETRKVDGVIG